MSAQPPGRRTESLFDNRYRYDHIYPRGRSGETLRAYDTQDNDRPVVIKRPAPQDAPPMRAGQEVSIRTERQALERLSGHPVLCELRGSGTFRVGGHSHEYIVMDLARGQVVEALVLEHAEHQSYLPELEVLVIMDRLLDLLIHAHDKQVIYNDVDAKHLFWDRDTYQLKVIDWGNAVFLDEPGALSSVNRTTDIYQCGELLYFILTGGNRLTVETGDDGETFYVNFGPDAERIAARLQSILTRAIHPDPQQRFGTLLELRHALREYRAPLERQRDDIISRLRKRVRPTASQDELEELRTMLQDALAMDPGFPDACRLDQEITQFLAHIQFQADLDAIRIYLESGNWPRALSLLYDLQPGAGSNTPLLRFLIAAAAQLDELNLTPPPAGFLAALDPLFDGDAPAAGYTLLVTEETRHTALLAHWLLAEHLAVHMPDVTLLRPHLVRLRHELGNVSDMEDVITLLDATEDQLRRPPLSGLTGLQVIYQEVGAILSTMEETLEASSTDSEAQETALASVIRARRAAQAILAHLENVGRTAYSDPAEASAQLHRAGMINPTATHFAALHDYFDEVHQAITALSQFRPRSNGSNLSEWFGDVQQFIQPYLDDLPDPQLHQAAAAVQRTGARWMTVLNYLALGRRQPVIDVLRQAAEGIRPFNETLAAWFGTLANRVPDAAHPERLSPNEALADKLIEGWQAWDQGNGIAAIEIGEQAHALANTDGERLAADRLRRMGELLDQWASAGGNTDPQATDRAETEALAILLTEEEHERRTFAEQMPSTSLYLRAMSRGIVAYMHQSSSAGWRALYLHYVLRGMLALFDDQLEEAEFWREVASKSFDSARTHRAFQVLDRALTSRLLIQKAQRALNAVARPGDLDAVRQAINIPLAGDILGGLEQALNLIDTALRNWSDGEFYTSHQALNDALQHTDQAIEHAQLNIEPFVNWLTMLRDAAAELQQARLSIEQGAATTSETVDPILAEAHAQIVTVTQRVLGTDYVHQVRQWEETYQAVLETYTTQRLTRNEKLAAFSRHFASLFINRHPAYPLFRHWEGVIEQLPPDEHEDAMIDLDHAEAVDPAGVAYLDDDDIVQPVPQREPGAGSDLPWNWIIAAAVLALIAIIGYAVIRNLGDDDATGDDSGSGASGAVSSPTVDDGAALVPPTTLPSPTDVPVIDAPTATAITAAPTATTTLPPEPTSTPFAIPTTPPATATEPPPPTMTPTLFVTNTLQPTNTPQAIAAAPSTSGRSDMLAALAALPAAVLPGPQGSITPGSGSTWVLTTADADSTEVQIDFPPELLSELFQPGAASSLRRADVVLELITYDQTSEVAFGLGAANVAGEQTIGQAQFTTEGFVSLGLNQNGRFRSSTEFPQQNLQLELSLRRTNTNTISFYVDDRWLGDSVFLFPQGEPLTLILYLSGRNVVVEVDRFEIDFSPRDVIP